MSIRRNTRKPFVRNHYLPKWLHRVCNAFFAAVAMLLLLIFVTPLHFALTVDALVFLLVFCIDPSKLSFVEGLAGGDGYVDLDDEP